MKLYPTSAQQRVPRMRWAVVLAGGFLLFAVFAAILETRLAIRGFKPSVIDSAPLWIRQRQRADALGARALILVGSSRVLLDTDLSVLRRETGLEPVQLAVDGSSFVPVLQDLAADPEVKGTVLVDLAENVLALPAQYDTAYGYEAAYQRSRARRLPDFDSSETYLTALVRGRVRSYADGTKPLTALCLRILQKNPTPQYLRMLQDREILADYSRVPQPLFYYARIMRNLGQTVPTEGRLYRDIEMDFASRIAALPPFDNKLFLQWLPAMADMTRAIRAHGGRVIYVTYPTSGYIRAIDDKRFPRPLFWDRFVAAVDAPHLNFEDVDSLRRFYCPDGSHLDYHARAAFTTALVRALGLNAATPGE